MPSFWLFAGLTRDRRIPESDVLTLRWSSPGPRSFFGGVRVGVDADVRVGVRSAVGVVVGFDVGVTYRVGIGVVGGGHGGVDVIVC